MIMQNYRTTCFSDEPLIYESSFTDTATWKEEVVGIRLVRGSDEQKVRGNNRRAGSVTLPIGPRQTLAGVSFRLVADERME